MIATSDEVPDSGLLVGKSRYCNTFKVSQDGRSVAISSFRDALLAERALYASLLTLSGTGLVCHCRPSESCHGDINRRVQEILSRRTRSFFGIMKFLLIPGSTAPWPDFKKNQKARKVRVQTRVGVGCTQRDFCDGQSLASPGRWPPGSRVYPSSRSRASGSDCFTRFTSNHGTEQLLVSLAMGKIDSCPFPLDDVASLKESVIVTAAGFGHQIERRSGDRSDVTIDYQFLDLLLRVAEDPETGLGEYAQGVKVGLGTRMPRLPALFKPKKKWRLASQVDPLDYIEHALDKEGVWRRNYSTLQAFEEQVFEVMYDQASRGQIIVLSEKDAKDRHPD